MAATFDGDNLLITLPEAVGGSLEISVEQDLYSDWKEWMKLSDNSKYILAFTTSGGEPITDTLDSGSYFTLNNADGWRIKPFEADATYTFTGNLIPNDTALPIFTATTGAYTVFINGLQPITQQVLTGGSGTESIYLSVGPLNIPL